MIQGRFEIPSHRPLIAANVSSGKPIGSQVIGRPGTVSFLADTGADCSILSLQDATRLQVDFDLARVDVGISGLAGRQRYRQANVRVAFYDDEGKLQVYFVDMSIMSGETYAPGSYSVLGRDVMDCWATTFARCCGRLDAVVYYADFSLPYSHQ